MVMFEHIKMALDVNGNFVITDMKNGTFLVFPIKKFNEKAKGDTHITLIINEKEFEQIAGLKEYIAKLTNDFAKDFDKRDKQYVAEAFADVKNNPLRLPNLLLYSAELMCQDIGCDTMTLGSGNKKFTITRVEEGGDS